VRDLLRYLVKRCGTSLVERCGTSLVEGYERCDDGALIAFSVHINGVLSSPKRRRYWKGGVNRFGWIR